MKLLNLLEMAQPSQTTATFTLYHGAPDENIEQIKRDGFLKGREQQGKARQAPTAGYVYTSKDVMYAVGYAGGYSQWGSGCTRARRDAEPGTFHYTVFVVDHSEATDVLADEDMLGYMGTISRTQWAEKYPNVPTYLMTTLQQYASDCATLSQWQNRDVASVQSAIGKKLQKKLPVNLMHELMDHINEIGVKTVDNKVKFSGYYTIDRVTSNETDFFKYAKYTAL